MDFKIHFFHRDKLITKRLSHTVPREKELVRLNPDKYYRVVEVVWCFDETSTEGQRVNIEVINA